MAFAELRYTVPRFLFRMWTNKSGGGPEKSTNSPAEIVPHRFKQGTVAPEFYDTPEMDLREMVNLHYDGDKNISSTFSSWSASLHLVLCFARSMDLKDKTQDHNPHDPQIAVMDTKKLDSDVLVWHCPDLDLKYGVHEYMAYGPIKGKRGYRAVSFQVLRSHGILQFFPGLQDRVSLHQFSHRLR